MNSVQRRIFRCAHVVQDGTYKWLDNYVKWDIYQQFPQDQTIRIIANHTIAGLIDDNT